MSIRGLAPFAPFPYYPEPTLSQEVKQIALASIAKIRDLGCGVLFGIDRMIVPLHVISSRCPEELSVQFSYEEQSIFFPVLQIIAMDPVLDCAILQLGALADGSYPGNVVPFPQISCREHRGPFVLSSFDGELPSLQMGDGAPCCDVNFCSDVWTGPGCSGGGYIDLEGRLFAIHLSRSSGACDPFTLSTTKALYLKDLVFKYPALFGRPVCTPLSPPQTTCCAPLFVSNDPCFSEEGGGPVIHFKIPSQNQVYQCWEMRSGHGGAGRRGLTVVVPGVRDKITYEFNVNPHHVKEYNKNQVALYYAAGSQFIREYEKKKKIPDSFAFEAYGVTFTAS